MSAENSSEDRRGWPSSDYVILRSMSPGPDGSAVRVVERLGCPVRPGLFLTQEISMAKIEELQNQLNEIQEELNKIKAFKTKFPEGSRVLVRGKVVSLDIDDRNGPTHQVQIEDGDMIWLFEEKLFPDPSK